MPLSLDVQAAVDIDLELHADWLRDQAGADVAARFLDATFAAFAKLADMPGLGTPVEPRAPELAGARKWKVAGFPNQLVFYLVEEEALVVLRVLHAASDWRAD